MDVQKAVVVYVLSMETRFDDHENMLIIFVNGGNFGSRVMIFGKVCFSNIVKTIGTRPQRVLLQNSKKYRLFERCFGYRLKNYFSQKVMQVLSEGALSFLTQWPFSRGGTKKRKSNNDDKHGQGQEKKDTLSIMLREKVT